MAEKETIYGQVVPKSNNYIAVPDGAGGRRIIKGKNVRAYERSFIEQCRIYAGRNIDTEFVLHIVVWEKAEKFDLDNSLKTVLDCLQYAGAITDDRLCREIHSYKRIDPANPRITFAIEELHPQRDFFKRAPSLLMRD